MYKNKTFLSIIPARGGSKRLPKKNLLKLKNKPLIAYSINAALKSKYIDKIIVSSESKLILNFSKKLGVDTVKRPKKLAKNNSTIFEVIKNVLKYVEPNKYEYIVLLQPTSPLRNEKNIDEAIKLLDKKKVNAVISVCKCSHSPLWSNLLPKNDSMVNFLKKDALNKQSQELKEYYRLNGAIYICKLENLLKEKSFFLKKKIVAYKMPEYQSVDIDTKLDFIIAKTLLKN
jgi:CMP-N,N'-diacetyllegionaminic acid synthase